MIVRKVNNRYFGWDPSAYRGKGYWFELSNLGQLGRAASKKEYSELGHPKEYSEKYSEAQKISKTSFGESVIEKLLSGKGLGSSVGSTISEKIKARLTKIKQAFDPLNIIHSVFGGGGFANVMTTWIGKKLGRSEKDIKFFTGNKSSLRDIKKEDTTELKITGSISLNTKKIITLLNKHFSNEQKLYNKKRKDEESHEELLEIRNRKLIRALTGKEKINVKKIKPELKTGGEILKDIEIGVGVVAVGKLADDEIDSLIPKLKIKSLKDVEELIAKIEKFLKRGISKEIGEERPTVAPKVEAAPTPSGEAPVAPGSAGKPAGTVSGAPGEAPRVTRMKSPETTASRVSETSKREGKIKPMEQETGKLPELSGKDLEVAQLIKQHEGLRMRPYKDTMGYWTVGYGHFIGKNLPASMDRDFSMDEINELFNQDYFKHKMSAEQIPNFDKLNSDGQAALIDMTFNMGTNWWKKWPRFTKAMQTGDIEGAINSMKNSLWFKEVGNRSVQDVALLKTNLKNDGSSILQQSSDNSMMASDNTVIQKNTIVAQNTTENNSLIKPNNDSSNLIDKAKA